VPGDAVFAVLTDLPLLSAATLDFCAIDTGRIPVNPQISA